MVVEEVLVKAAASVLTAAARSPMAKGAALRAVNREPAQLAVKRALESAASEVGRQYPQWSAALFDASFLKNEAAGVLAMVITRGQRPSAAALARTYVRSLVSTGERLPLVREVEPVAACLLEAFTCAIRAEQALAEALDSKALDAMAEDLAAVRAALDAGRATESTLWDYVQWVIDRNLYLDPRGTYQTQRQVKLPLDQVFISLDAAVVGDLDGPDKDLPDEAEARTAETGLAFTWETSPIARLPAGPGRPVRGRDGSARIDVSDTPRPWIEVIAQHSQVVVLGDPGGGKTTLLRHLALLHAKALADPDTVAEGDLPAERARLPILVRLADYAEGGRWRSESLTDFLAAHCAVSECPSAGLADLFGSWLGQGRCQLLLDGLDEITATSDRLGIVGRVEEFTRRHARAGNRFVVTSRVAGYRAGSLAGDFVHFRALDMSREQIEGFLRRWCAAVEDAQTPEVSERQRRATAEREVEGILSAVDHNPGVARLAVNPLMLRVLALIHSTGARLPQKRIELYKLAADTLTRTWRQAQGVPESALAEERHVTRLLGALADWMHTNRPSGIARQDEVLGVLGPLWARIVDQPWDDADPSPSVLAQVEGFLQAVRVHTGIFVERAPRSYGFLHLTFQEYYVARHLIARPRDRARLIRARLHDPNWQEPILLALGYVGLEYQEQSDDLVRAAVLARGEDAVDNALSPSLHEELVGRDFTFALRCLGDEIPVDQSLARELLTRATEELLHHGGPGRFGVYRDILRDRLRGLAKTPHEDTLAAVLLAASTAATSDWVMVAAPLVERPEVAARLLEVAGEAGLYPVVRGSAAQALEGVVEQPEVAARLLEVVGEAGLDPVVRGSAVQALGRVVERPEVVARLLEVVGDAGLDPVVRGSAVQALGRVVERPEVVARLLEVVGDAGLDPGVRGSAARALAGVVERPEVTARLLELAGEAGLYPWVRGSAARALGGVVERPEVTARLLELAGEAGLYPWVRGSAAQALGRVVERPEVTARLLELAGEAGLDPEVRGSAAQALEGVVERSEVAARLLELAGEAGLDSEVRGSAAQVLEGVVERSEVAARLLELAGEAGLDPEVRGSAAQALGRVVERPEVAARLLELAGEAGLDPEVRGSAAQALGRVVERPEVAARLLELAGDRSGPGEVVRGLLSFVGSTAPHQTRAEAVPLLTQLLLRTDALSEVLEVLLDDDNDVRKACVQSMVDVGATSGERYGKVWDLLAGVLDDPRFEYADKHEHRPAKDYAYQGLLMLLATGASAAGRPD